MVLHILGPEGNLTTSFPPIGGIEAAVAEALQLPQDDSQAASTIVANGLRVVRGHAETTEPTVQ